MNQRRGGGGTKKDAVDEGGNHCGNWGESFWFVKDGP
jgi:hypothetical protein